MTIVINDADLARKSLKSSLSGGEHVIHHSIEALLSALPSGSNTIGKVEVTALPAFGQFPATLGQKDADHSLSVVLANNQPTLTVTGSVVASGAVSLGAALPAGDNNIGNVDVLSLPPLPIGANAIGTVGVTSLPALSAGSNNIGDVDVASLPNPPASATCSAVHANFEGAVTLFAAKSDRTLAVVYNPTEMYLYIKLGTGASLSPGGYSYVCAPVSHWELPRKSYGGIITGIFDSGDADVTCTET